MVLSTYGLEHQNITKCTNFLYSQYGSLQILSDIFAKVKSIRIKMMVVTMMLLTKKREVGEAARAAYSKPLPTGISDIACNYHFHTYVPFCQVFYCIGSDKIY